MYGRFGDVRRTEALTWLAPLSIHCPPAHTHQPVLAALVADPSGGAKVVPADCLLLDGTCIVEEAVLTGESTPTWKIPASELDPNATLNMKLVGWIA